MIFFQFTAVFLSCHSLYFYFAKNTINNLAETLTDILNGSLGSLLGIELDTSQFYHDLDLLNSVQDIGGATCIATTTLSPDGTMAVINLDQGLGPILTQNLIDILQNLKTSINNLHAKGIGLADLINLTLAPLKLTATLAIDNLLTPLLGGTDPTGVVDTLTQQLLAASVLGDTAITIPTTIYIPATSTGVVDSKFVGTVVQTDLLNVDLLTTADGVSSVFWADQALPDETAPEPPVITSTTGNSTDGYTVTGTAEPGSTVTIYDAGHAVVGTAVTDEDGNFTVTLPGTVGAEAQLTATATDAAGNESEETPFSTPADPADTTAPAGGGGGGGGGGGSGTAYYTNKEDTTFYAVYDGPVTYEHKHYMKGYDTGIFGPEDYITRAQVAAIIARACLEGFQGGTDYGNGGYTDVADDHWARSAIAFVTTAGVFVGDGEGHFEPDRPITRQEFALVLARMAGLLNVGEMPFSDIGTTADWAISGVYTAYAKGWLHGFYIA